MEYTQAEILQTVRMTEMEHLDVRTVTLGLSLRDCVRSSVEETAAAVREKIERTAARLVETVDAIGDEMGIRVANKRISITPASLIAGAARSAVRSIDSSAQSCSERPSVTVRTSRCSISVIRTVCRISACVYSIG